MSHALPTNLGPMAEAASKESTKFAMTGVHVTLDEKEKRFTVVATNAKIMAIAEGPLGNSDEMPRIPALEAAPNGAMTGLVPKEFWKKFFSQAKSHVKKVKKAAQAVGIAMSGTDVTLGASNLESPLTCSARLVEGRFPPYKEVIPKKEPVAKISFGISELENLLKAAKAFTTEGNDRFEFQLFDLEGRRPALLRIDSPETGQKFTGLIMPIS